MDDRQSVSVEPDAAETQADSAVQSAADESSDEHALVAATKPEEPGEPVDELPALVALLPVEMDVSVPVRGFRVRHLLTLAPGQIVESQWVHSNDLTLTAGEVQLAWSEFEVIENRLAVRVTRLAGEVVAE
jgi:flagellar motor switch protein FliN/FliY